jgi:uncharacterized membrane protein
MAGNQNVVVALFADEASAEGAKNALMKWDKANDDIKLGAVGTITKKGDKVKTHVGRSVGKGTWTGAVVGLIAAMFPPVALAGGILGGATLGGLTGVFFKKPLNLTKDDVQQIAAELEAGKTALVATCDDYEVEQTRAELASLGGTVWWYGIPEETLVAAAAELPASVIDEPAAQEAAATEPPVTMIDEPAAPVAQEVAPTKPLFATIEERAASASQLAVAEALSATTTASAAAPAVQEAPAEAEA